MTTKPTQLSAAALAALTLALGSMAPSDMSAQGLSASASIGSSDTPGGSSGSNSSGGGSSSGGGGGGSSNSGSGGGGSSSSSAGSGGEGGGGPTTQERVDQINSRSDSDSGMASEASVTPGDVRQALGRLNAEQRQRLERGAPLILGGVRIENPLQYLN